MRRAAILASLVVLAMTSNVQAATASQQATARGKCSFALNNTGAGPVTVNAQGACAQAPASIQGLSDLIASQFAASELNHLKAVWTLRNVPQAVRDVVTLGDLISDSELYTDDDITRTPRALWTRARDGWNLRNKIGPTTVAIAQGRFDPSYYEGEDVQTAIKRWSGKNNGSDWSDELGSRLRYTGPEYQLIFPLNIASNAAISLGNPADDPVLTPQADADGSFELGDWLRQQGNFGFSASANLSATTLRLSWEYDERSLGRAVEANGYKVTAGFPLRFSFFLVHSPLKKGDYADVVKDNKVSLETKTAPPAAWNAKSRLEIYVNGLQGPHYVYEVTHAGDGAYMEDLGGYDEPEERYKYTRFDCRLLSIELGR